MPRAVRAGPEHPLLLDPPEAPAALPRSLAPMRPRLARSGFNSPDHLFELKWDGIRALVSQDQAGLRIVDRNGGDLLPAVPELRSLRLPEGTLLDGEVIVCDSRGRPSYDLLVGRLGPKASKRGKGPLVVAFDLLYDDHRPLLGLPLEVRRERLRARALARYARARRGCGRPSSRSSITRAWTELRWWTRGFGRSGSMAASTTAASRSPSMSLRIRRPVGSTGRGWWSCTRSRSDSRRRTRQAYNRKNPGGQRPCRSSYS